MKTPESDKGQQTAPPVPPEMLSDPEYIPSLTAQIKEINARTQELHRLLSRHAATLEHEGLQQQMATLENWLRMEAESLALAARIFEMGPVWLEELHQRLNLASEELARLEDEGGNPPASKGAPREVEELADVCNAVSGVLESMGKVFADHPTGETASAVKDS